MRHRPSSIKLWDDCPFSAYHTYYGGNAPLSNEYKGYAVGSAFHELMRSCIQSDILGEKVEPDMTGIGPEAFLEATRLFESFMEHFTYDPELVIVCEDAIEHGNVRGKPDLVMYLDNTSVIIIDWKTAWSEQGTEYDSLAYYAAIIAQNDPKVKSFVLRVAMVRWGHYLDDVFLTRDQALDTWGLLRSKMKDIETSIEMGHIGARASLSCAYCRVRGSCPLTKEERHTGALIESQDDALELANMIVAQDSRISELKDALKAWTTEHGPVEMKKGLSWGPKLSETESLDTTSLRRIMKDDPEITVKLSDYLKEKKSTRFGLIKD